MIVFEKVNEIAVEVVLGKFLCSQFLKGWSYLVFEQCVEVRADWGATEEHQMVGSRLCWWEESF